ncbi:MAG TPA: phage major capsid protein [Nocardioidaceae bacterium]|nr:phage major capsid protein [Nocardioidaceae bacterium]
MSTITTEGLELEFPELKQTLGAIDEKAKALATVFEEAGSDMDLSKVKSVDGGKDAVLAFIRDTNTELSELGVKRDELAALARGLKFTKGYDPEQYAHLLEGEGAPSGRTQRSKSFGEMFVESKAAGEMKGREVEIPFEVKTLFATSAGWAPESTRTPRLVLDEQRPVQLVPLIPQRPTGQTAIKYMEETTFTNAAAETAEGGTKPEAALALTERTSDVRKIPVWIPVTDEQLEDVEGIQQYLENRLEFMVMQRLDGQIAAGNGTAPNLRGLLNVVGIQTQAKGTDPTPDAFYKAMTKVRVTGQAIPNVAVMHPNDWQDIRLLRTADGVYIWGNPSEAGPERIWGLTVAQVQAMTENTGVVLDTQFTELAWRKGMSIKVSDSHGTYFIENKQAVRAEIRVAFTVFRPTAVCSVTGI